MIRSSLSRHVAATPLDDGEVRRLAAAVWHAKGLALIDPAQVRDDLERQAIINAANRQFGKRQQGGTHRGKAWTSED